MAKINETEHTSINLIGSGTTIKGEVTASGDIRVDGSINGNIQTKGKLVVGNTGTIDGEIVCQNADISGRINAKMQVKELLTLKSTAHFNGEITVSQLAIEPGAIFSGSCSMEKPSISANRISTPDNQNSQSK
jgi:cytoskeletal protein CcmA (bactofilin family)